MTCQIIEANRNHADILAELHAASFRWSWDRSVMQGYIANPHVLTLVALSLKTHQPCGFTMARFVVDEAEVLTIAVSPKIRKKGVGRALCERMFHELASRDIDLLHLEVSEENKGAIRLYESLGFLETGRRNGYYPSGDGRGKADALLMQRNLRCLWDCGENLRSGNSA